MPSNDPGADGPPGSGSGSDDSDPETVLFPVKLHPATIARIDDEVERKEAETGRTHTRGEFVSSAIQNLLDEAEKERWYRDP